MMNSLDPCAAKTTKHEFFKHISERNAMNHAISSHYICVAISACSGLNWLADRNDRARDFCGAYGRDFRTIETSKTRTGPGSPAGRSCPSCCRQSLRDASVLEPSFIDLEARYVVFLLHR